MSRKGNRGRFAGPQKKAEITYSLDDLKKMTVAELNDVLMKKPKIRGTVVVRRADGTPKYDNEARFKEGVRQREEELENER